MKLSDDDDNEITEQEAVEVLSNLDEEFEEHQTSTNVYERDGHCELLNRAGEIVIAKKIEERTKINLSSNTKISRIHKLFLKIFKDDEEIESLTSDYILDVKEKHVKNLKQSRFQKIMI